MNEVTDGSEANAQVEESGPRRAKGMSLWSGRVTQNIGQQVRHWRRHRKLTTQMLSDATEALGQRIPRTVLTNLEHGRRDYISVAELLLIAAALNVPPILLVAPIGLTDKTEALPKQEVSPWRTRGWLMGAIPPRFEGFGLEDWNDATTAIKVYDTHRLLVRSYQEAVQRLKDLDDDRMDIYPGRQWPEQQLQQRRRFRSAVLSQLATFLEQLRAHRREIETMGLVVPALPPEVEADLASSPISAEESVG